MVQLEDVTTYSVLLKLNRLLVLTVTSAMMQTITMATDKIGVKHY